MLIQIHSDFRLLIVATSINYQHHTQFTNLTNITKSRLLTSDNIITSKQSDQETRTKLLMFYVLYTQVTTITIMFFLLYIPTHFPLRHAHVALTLHNGTTTLFLCRLCVTLLISVWVVWVVCKLRRIKSILFPHASTPCIVSAWTVI